MVVPAPARLKAQSGPAFRLTADTPIIGDPDAAASLAALVSARTELPVERARRDETRLPGDGAHDVSSQAAAATSLNDHDDQPRIELRVGHGAPESYQLVADAASVVVTGGDAAGLFYGVQTLGQLIERDDDGWLIAATEIDDAPRFAYRGVMLDVARHFHPVETVKGYIDRAAGLKLNHLHLHLSDDQGWRLQLACRPELTERASATSVWGDPGGFYTADDYREIVAHAAARHMTVVPELDMPGHTHAVGVAYPELVEEPVLSDLMEEVRHRYGGGVPTPGVLYDGLAVGFSSLKTGDEATYAFVADVFGELVELTPGPYLHFGGDEALGTPPEDFAAFVARTSAIVAALGKTPIAWHEASAADGLAPGTVGQYWGYVTPTDGMDDRARAFVANGGRLILSPADALYLDMQHPETDRVGLTWANGPTSVEFAYSWEPSDIIAGIDDSAILGVEAPMWSETIRTAADIDELAFPRIAAAAEAAWSPPLGSIDDRMWASFRERVGALGPLWAALGIGFHRSPEIEWRAS